MTATGAADFVPASHDIGKLASAARRCMGCELYIDATQSVFGAGSSHADMMRLGEQPGDQEHTAGAPFVGPAGRLLDKALAATDIDRDRLYVTTRSSQAASRSSPAGRGGLPSCRRCTRVSSCCSARLQHNR